MKFHVDFWLLIADGYNLLLGIFSVPLSTSRTNMSRSEQAVPEAPSDLEINLSLLRLVVGVRVRSPAEAADGPLSDSNLSGGQS